MEKKWKGYTQYKRLTFPHSRNVTRQQDFLDTCISQNIFKSFKDIFSMKTIYFLDLEKADIEAKHMVIQFMSIDTPSISCTIPKLKETQNM